MTRAICLDCPDPDTCTRGWSCSTVKAAWKLFVAPDPLLWEGDDT